MRRAEDVLGPEVRRIVVIDPAFLGDVVFDGPLVRALREGREGAFVGLVVRPPADGVARRMVGVDRVHVFDKRGRDRGLGGLLRVARELRAEGYDAALVPHPSVRSALLARQAGIPRRVGSAPGALARALLTHPRPALPSHTYPSERLALLGAGAGAREAGLEGTLRAAVPPRPEGRRRVGLVLGSQWETKRWAIEQAVRFATALDRGTRELVLLGSEGERPLFDALRAAARGELPPCDDRIGGTVEALIDAIASLDVLVAGDTGPLHVARALRVPVVALFGPTPEARHGLSPRDALLVVEGLECRPCSDHGGRVCPERHHRCMKELGGDRVVSAVERALRIAEGR